MVLLILMTGRGNLCILIIVYFIVGGSYSKQTDSYYDGLYNFENYGYNDNSADKDDE